MLIIQRPRSRPSARPTATASGSPSARSSPASATRSATRLRRTLLSSIPGAAVTQVRFDDALHEFDTIPGVTEDVTDIILNLKDLVLRSTADEPVTLRLDVRGPAEVTAGRHPDQRPTSRSSTRTSTSPPLNAKGRLALDLTVEQGRGYLSADRNKTLDHDRRHPGRRDLLAGAPGHVLGRADPRRAVHRTTTASCSTSRPTARSRPARRSPRPAPRCAALVQLVAEMSDEPQGLELGEVAVAAAGSPDLELPIEELDLSERPRNCLKRAQVNTIGELLAEDRGRPAGHHQLRPEVARRGHRRSSTSAACRSAAGTESNRCRTPKKGRRFGGNAAHQRLMMANLAASLFAAEGIVTTEAKAKALRPIAEKLITKAKKGGLHNHRQVVAYIGDKEMASQAVRRDRPPLRRPPGRLHPHPQARPPPRRQRADGAHRAGLTDLLGTMCDRRPTPRGRPTRVRGRGPAAGAP